MSKQSKPTPGPSGRLASLSNYEVKVLLIHKTHVVNSLLGAEVITRRGLTESEKNELLICFQELPELFAELKSRGGVSA